MTKTKLLCAGVAGGLMLGSFALGTAFAKGAAPAKTPELSLLKDLTWTALMKEAPLPAMAPIQGDANKGAYTGFLKLPAGFESPAHAHTNDYWSVLIQGKMTHWAVNGGSEKDAKQISVGDVTFMPGKVEHVSKCYPGADCIMVITQKGKSDFLPAKAVAKKEEKPAAAAPTAIAVKKEEKPAAAAPAAAAPTATAAKPATAAAPVAAAAKKEEKPATPASGSEKSGPAATTAAAPAAAPAKTAAAAPAAPATKTPAAAPAAPATKTPAAAPAAAPAPAAVPAPAAAPAPAKK